MTPAEFVRLRFGPLFDRIEETHGEIPEELLACLVKGVIVEAMVEQAKAPTPERSMYYGSPLIHASRVCDGELWGTHNDLPGVYGPDAIFAVFTDGTDYITKTLGSEAEA